jgi:hypothetical protein
MNGFRGSKIDVLPGGMVQRRDVNSWLRVYQGIPANPARFRLPERIRDEDAAVCFHRKHRSENVWGTKQR